MTNDIQTLKQILPLFNELWWNKGIQVPYGNCMCRIRDVKNVKLVISLLIFTSIPFPPSIWFTMNSHVNHFFQRYVVLYILYIPFIRQKHSNWIFLIEVMYFFFLPLYTCLYYIYYMSFTALLSHIEEIRHNRNTMNVLLSLIMMCFNHCNVIKMQ